jgi:serine protease AprX
VKSRRIVAALCGVALAASSAVTFSAHATITPNGAGLSRLLARPAVGPAVGIATFSDVPTAVDVARLTSLGLEVQAMKQLPLAIVKGSVASMQQAVVTGAANDVYPDERVQLFDTTSSNAMGGATTRASGFTGKGVTVAVVDSGCDATHPDLADHVVHNVMLFGPEYGNMPPDPKQGGQGALVVPIEQLPNNNSDLGSGHGTHVAGIIAADGHTGPDHLGVAPDADLVCYSIGEVLFTTAVISAYDHMLDQPDHWGIDVANNSWGNSFRAYDPNDPVNVATRYATINGITVVFASGNAGGDDAELSQNPFSMPPWVISVAADSVDKVRASFSSNGSEYDNSQDVALSANGHNTFTGSRVGIYHPDVTAPGDKISSSCDTTGTVVGPCPPGENTEASGTSMASPHVAGAAAVLLQARPALKPAQVLSALQVTAVPVTNNAKPGIAPFWEAGYGHVNLAEAVKLVRRSDYASQLTSKQAAADAKVLASLPYKVQQSDVWMWDSPPITVEGSDTRNLDFNVSSTIKALKVDVGYPSLSTVGVNGFEYVVSLYDAAGKLLGTSETNFSNGTSTLFVNLRTVPGGVNFNGPMTAKVVGNTALSDPDTLDSDSALGRKVTVLLAQVR